MENGKYEIRLDGETVCVSGVKFCGYPVQRLRQIIADGYRYYENGKLIRKPE